MDLAGELEEQEAGAGNGARSTSIDLGEIAAESFLWSSLADMTIAPVSLFSLSGLG